MAEIIISFIIGLALVGLACQGKALRGYLIEKDHLDRAEIAMSAIGGEGTIDALIANSSVSEKSIVGHRIRQVKAIANSPEPPSVADLSAADFERDDSRFASLFPNTLISILLIAGLAGTLCSFTSIMADFPDAKKLPAAHPTAPEPAASTKEDAAAESKTPPDSATTPRVSENKKEDETIVEIKKWMSTAYRAFGTAFIASLAGIIGTVLLLIFRSFVHSRRSDLFDQLDRFTAGSLYSQFVEKKATDATTLKLAGDKLLQTAGSFETSVVKMESIPAALTSSTTGLSDATDEMRGALKNATETFTDFKAGFAQNGAMRKSFLRLEESVGGFSQQTEVSTGILREAVSGAASVLHGAANSVKLAGDSIASVGGKIASAGEGIERSVAQLLAGNTAHAAKMDALIRALGGIVETTNRYQREWNEAILPAIRAMTETAGRLETSVGPLNTRTEAFVKAADQMEKSAAQLVASGEAQVQQFGSAAGKMEKAIAESGANQQTFIAKATADLTAASNAQAERLRTSAATIDRATDQASSSHRGFLTELEPALKELPALAQKQTALLEHLAGIGAELNAEIARLGLRTPATKRSFVSKLKFWQK